MCPIALPKTNLIGKDLWQIFIDDVELPELDRHRFAREIDALERSDPEGAAFLEATLGAICNEENKAIKLAETAKSRGLSEKMSCNLVVLLVNMGKMTEAYTLARQNHERFPMSQMILQDVIHLADAFEDAQVLEKTLEAWQKLYPDHTHPLLVLHLLESGLEGADMEAMEGLMADFLERSDLYQQTPRSLRRIRSLLSRTEVE